MATKRQHVTFSFEVDEHALELYRAKLDESGDLDLFPGPPDEWRSMTDVVDLLQADPPAIIRSELLSVTEGPAAWAPSKPSRLKRLLSKLSLAHVFVVTVLAAGVLAAAGAPRAEAAVIVGTIGNDYLVGSYGPDVIRGLEGGDELRGRAGDDIVVGGEGPDLIVGGAGSDELRGGYGPDIIFSYGGTSGIDLVACGPGSDRAYVGPKDLVGRGCEVVEVIE